MVWTDAYFFFRLLFDFFLQGLDVLLHALVERLFFLHALLDRFLDFLVPLGGILLVAAAGGKGKSACQHHYRSI